MKDRKAVLEDGTIAGSATNLYEVYEMCDRHGGAGTRGNICSYQKSGQEHWD